MAKKLHTSKPRPTKAEMRQRLQQVELMLSTGWRHTLIVAACRTHFSIGPKATEKLITRVYKKWRQGSKKTKSELRMRQVNRLHALLEKDGLTVTERVRVETLLARIQGTEAPIQHGGVDGSESIKMIITDYRGQSAPEQEWSGENGQEND